jgi:hypothetical protein
VCALGAGGRTLARAGARVERQGGFGEERLNMKKLMTTWFPMKMEALRRRRARHQRRWGGAAAKNDRSFHCPLPGPCHAAVTLDLRTSRENDRSLDSMEQGRLEERGEERSGLRAASEPHRATSPRLKTASDDAPSHRQPNPCPEPSCLACRLPYLACLSELEALAGEHHHH